MPRAHAPLLAAFLGVGLVLAFTSSPEAGIPPARAGRALAAVAAIGAPPTWLAAPVPEAAPGAQESGATPFVVEDERLARFVVPRDRLALSAAGVLSRAPLQVDEGPPVIVALVASWCRPCAAELPLVLESAAAIGARVVLVAEDDVAGPESLRAVIEDLFAAVEPSSRALPALELRADPDGAWLAATAPLLEAPADPGALPQTLLFHRGRLALLVQGGLDRDVAARFEMHMEAR